MNHDRSFLRNIAVRMKHFPGIPQCSEQVKVHVLQLRSALKAAQASIAELRGLERFNPGGIPLRDVRLHENMQKSASLERNYCGRFFWKAAWHGSSNFTTPLCGIPSGVKGMSFCDPLIKSKGMLDCGIQGGIQGRAKQSGCVLLPGLFRSLLDFLFGRCPPVPY